VQTHTRPGAFAPLAELFGHGAFDPMPGSRCCAELEQSRGVRPSADAFVDARRQLVDRVCESHRGPLDRDVASAGWDRSADCKLQQAITSQLENAAFDTLDRELRALPADDARRVAWLSTGSFSSLRLVIGSFPPNRLETIRGNPATN
jgi:hypothetical protein